MRPHVIEYLKTHTFRQLAEEHGVNARPNARMDKFSLNYDSILAKSSDPLANQCRGLIVRPVHLFGGDAWEDVLVGDVEILAWPMNRFFNLGDPAAAIVDWNDPQLQVLDKVDGTCCIVYWDEQQQRWHCATRSVPEADLPIKKDHIVIGDMTFSDLFFQTFNELWKQKATGLFLTLDPTLNLRRGWTYVFELTSPYNRIVVDYPKPGLTLLAIRDNETGVEVEIDSPSKNFIYVPWIPRPKSWQINDPQALKEFLNTQDPTKCEGAVVCDSHFNRVKIKSEKYLIAFRIKDMMTLSRRSVLEAVLAGHMDDVLPHLPHDIVSQIDVLQDKIREYFKVIDHNFHTWKTQAAGDRKAFALLVQEHADWQTPYFSMLKGSYASTSEWAADITKAGKLSQTTLENLVNKLGWNPVVG